MNERIKIAIIANVETLKDRLNRLEEKLNIGLIDDKVCSSDFGYCCGMLQALKFMIDSELYEELNNRYEEVRELYYRKVFHNED